jgi:tRNA(adenine34) deaminase
MMFVTVFGKEKDELLMKEALQEARKAFDLDEVPVGAVVVDQDGNIIARAFNSVERDCSQRSHAESLAIEYASKKRGDWRLNDCWLYVTLEPCAMCMGLIRLSRFSGVVYGASSPLFGFQLDKSSDISVYRGDAFSVIDGVVADESSALLKMFFQKRRKNSERKT